MHARSRIRPRVRHFGTPAQAMPTRLLFAASLTLALVTFAVSAAADEPSSAASATSAEPAPEQAPVPLPKPSARIALAPAPTPNHEQEKTTPWYGYQTLLVDAASVGLFVAGSAFDAPVAWVPATAGVFLGGPAVHFARGRVETGFVSLGLRLGLPVLGGTIGYFVFVESYWGPESGVGVLGAGIGAAVVIVGGGLIGLASASVLDAAWLARENGLDTSWLARQKSSAAPRVTPTARVTSVSPVFDASRRVAGVGVGGYF